jgi:uncharacterized membrane protein
MDRKYEYRRFVHRGDDLGRIISLSDGLFAIMLTLLVLEIKLPEAAGSVGLLDAMVALWPKMFSYLLTFLVTGVYWVAHHWDFQHIVRYDRRLMWLNLMFLLCISVLPASTALVGSHGNQSLPWIVYALNMTASGVMLTALWGYAVACRLIDPRVHPHLAHYVTLRHMVAPGVFLLSIGVALLVSGSIAQLTPLLIPPLQALLARFYSRKVSVAAADGGEEEAEQLTVQHALWQVVTFLPLIGFAGWSLWVWLDLPTVNHLNR